MMNKITIEISDEVYARLREAAAQGNRPIESVLSDSVTLLFDDEWLPPLDTLETYSDDQLWVVVFRRMYRPYDLQLSELTAQSKQQTLSSEAEAEMLRLLDYYDQWVLVRSQAMLLLHQRGYDVKQRLQIGA